MLLLTILAFPACSGNFVTEDAPNLDIAEFDRQISGFSCDEQKLKLKINYL